MKDGQYPTELRYTKDHEWAKKLPPTNIRGEEIEVGITRFAVDQLGDITLVNLDVKPGDTITMGKSFGTIESVKTLSDLYAPISGKVVRINKDLETRPELVNEDCYGKAWMIVIVPSDAKGIDGLMDVKAYEVHVRAQAH